MLQICITQPSPRRQPKPARRSAQTTTVRGLHMYALEKLPARWFLMVFTPLVRESSPPYLIHFLIDNNRFLFVTLSCRRAPAGATLRTRLVGGSNQDASFNVGVFGAYRVAATCARVPLSNNIFFSMCCFCLPPFTKR